MMLQNWACAGDISCCFFCKSIRLPQIKDGICCTKGLSRSPMAGYTHENLNTTSGFNLLDRT